jgi:uncharacterized phiE125 gp8 family phage protein
MKLAAETVSVGTEPSVEPVSVDEAKLHLRVDIATENDLITRLIAVARRHSEQLSGKAFITQTLAGGLSGWPRDGVIRLPYMPLQSVTSITYVDADGDTQTLAETVYGVDTKLGLIYLKNNQSWPTTALRDYDPITVTWVAGYGDAAADVPDAYKQAILLLVGHWFENRESVVVGQGYTATNVPMAVMDLLTIDGAYYHG